jgi:hypothetical protein
MAQLYRTTKAKTVAAAVGTFATVLVAVFADDVLDTSELGSLVAGAITAVATIGAVFQTRNKNLPPS